MLVTLIFKKRNWKLRLISLLYKVSKYIRLCWTSCIQEDPQTITPQTLSFQSLLNRTSTIASFAEPKMWGYCKCQACSRLAMYFTISWNNIFSFRVYYVYCVILVQFSREPLKYCTKQYFIYKTTSVSI